MFNGVTPEGKPKGRQVSRFWCTCTKCFSVHLMRIFSWESIMFVDLVGFD